jgi:hypothetical protein
MGDRREEVRHRRRAVRIRDRPERRLADRRIYTCQRTDPVSGRFWNALLYAFHSSNRALTNLVG